METVSWNNQRLDPDIEFWSYQSGNQSITRITDLGGEENEIVLTVLAGNRYLCGEAIDFSKMS